MPLIWPNGPTSLQLPLQASPMSANLLRNHLGGNLKEPCDEPVRVPRMSSISVALYLEAANWWNVVIRARMANRLSAFGCKAAQSLGERSSWSWTRRSPPAYKKIFINWQRRNLFGLQINYLQWVAFSAGLHSPTNKQHEQVCNSRYCTFGWGLLQTWEAIQQL